MKLTGKEIDDLIEDYCTQQSKFNPSYVVEKMKEMHNIDLEYICVGELNSPGYDAYYYAFAYIYEGKIELTGFEEESNF